MTGVLHGIAFFLLLNVIAGLVRVARGPTSPDRMLAAQLFGTTGVAILLVLAEALHLPPLRDVALVFALLAAVLAVAFVKRGRYRAGQGSVTDRAPDRGGVPDGAPGLVADPRPGEGGGP